MTTHMWGVEHFSPGLCQRNLRLIRGPQLIPTVLFAIVAAVKSVARRDRLMLTLRPCRRLRITRKPPPAGTGRPRPSGETRLSPHPTAIIAVAAAAAAASAGAAAAGCPVSFTPPAASAAATLRPGDVAPGGEAARCSRVERRSSISRQGRTYRGGDGVHENADLGET